MLTKSFLSLFIGCLVVFGQVMAQDGYKVGDEAMAFHLLSTSGDSVGPSSYDEAKGFIVVFTCNHCPVAKKYEERIIELNDKYSELGYPVIAINPNDAEAYPSDNYDAMIERAKEKGFTFNYVVDETQEVARTYGATKTPHTFILEKVEDKLVVRYIGSIDNSTNGTDITDTYVEDAVESLISGNEVKTTSTKAIGCSIKWKDS